MQDCGGGNHLYALDPYIMTRLCLAVHPLVCLQILSCHDVGIQSVQMVTFRILHIENHTFHSVSSCDNNNNNARGALEQLPHRKIW